MMSTGGPPSAWERTSRYLTREIWEKDLKTASRSERLFVPILRVGYLLGRGYGEHHLTVRASALTYITIVSLVPTLAVAFAMFKAFGGLQREQDVLMPKVLEYLSPGVRDEVAGRIHQFLSNVSGGAVGGISTVFLFLTAIFLVRALENALNEIWGVRRDRSFFQSVTLYWTMLTITPILLVAAMALPAVFQKIPFFEVVLNATGTGWLFFSVILPVVLACVAFTLMYGFLPNTKVSLRAAVTGGIVGGVLWSAAVSLYAWYASVTVSYSRIYGSLGAIPIFLLWIYITWLIILFGAEVSFALQNVSGYAGELRASNASQAVREILALRLMSEVSRSFMRGEPPSSAAALADTLSAPARLVNNVAHDLVETGLLFDFGEKHELVPGRDPHDVTPTDVLQALRRRGEARIWAEKDHVTRQIEVCHEHAEEAARQAWRGLTLADLALDRSMQAEPEQPSRAAARSGS